MSRARSMVFWWSLVAAMAGFGGAFAFGPVRSELFPATDASEEVAAETANTVANTDTSAAASTGGAPAISSFSIGTLLLFSLICFAAAWHGGAVSAMDEPLPAAALWGLLPAMLLAGIGIGIAVLVLWIFQDARIPQVMSWVLPLSICAGLAWELGYLGVRSWAPRTAHSTAASTAASD